VVERIDLFRRIACSNYLNSLWTGVVGIGIAQAIARSLLKQPQKAEMLAIRDNMEKKLNKIS